MSVAKSHVVSIRVEPHIKAALQSTAVGEMRSLANTVEVMAAAYCSAQRYPFEGVPDETFPNINLRGGVA